MPWIAILIIFVGCEVATIIVLKAAAKRDAERAYDDGVHDANDVITRRWREVATAPERTAAAERWVPDAMDGGSFVPGNFEPLAE